MAGCLRPAFVAKCKGENPRRRPYIIYIHIYIYICIEFLYILPQDKRSPRKINLIDRPVATPFPYIYSATRDAQSRSEGLSAAPRHVFVVCSEISRVSKLSARECICIHVYIYIYMYMYLCMRFMHIYTHIYLYIIIHVYTEHVYICIYTCAH